MGEDLINQGRLDMNRHPRSRKLLRRILKDADCLSCGACCRNPGKSFRLPVLGFEPFHEQLRKLCKTDFPGKMEEMPNGGFNLVGEGRCLLQSEDNLCQVYNVRPLVCATYPFQLKPMLNLWHDGSLRPVLSLVLTTSCPPIKEAKDAGVTYVALDDLISERSVDGRRMLVSDMPLLGPIMSIILNVQGEFYNPSHFIIRQNTVLFPVS